MPSIDLVGQTMRAWLPGLQAGTAIALLCSDPTVKPRRRELADHGVPESIVTTSVGKLEHFMHRHERVLVVSTYASLNVLAGCEEVDDVDLLVADEAHHLTNGSAKGQLVALDDELLRCRRRLFLTATPVVIDGIADDVDEADPFADAVGANGRRRSMDDETVFGPVASTYSVAEAIRDGYLCDYKVVVVAHVDSPSNAQRLPLLALASACVDEPVRRALSFHNRVAEASAFAQLLSTYGSSRLRFVADTVNGSTPARDRAGRLARLASPAAPGVTRVITAAQCLKEGVDVCAVDAVMFAAPRSSPVSIVQAVGRALRTAPGKTQATIIIPALVDARQDDDELTSTSFAHVWRVLRGLNAHDPRVAEAWRGVSTSHVRGGTSRQEQALPDWLRVTGGGVDLDQVRTRLVDGTSPFWDRMCRQVQEAAAELGGAHRITGTTSRDGYAIGHWVIEQRSRRKHGILPADKATRLEAVQGWAWDEEALTDHRMLDKLAEYAAEAGTVRDRTAGSHHFPAGKNSSPMGRWLARFRRTYRGGDLDKVLVDRAEALPGWTWEPLDDTQRAGVEAFRAFVLWEKQSSVPAGHVEDGFPLSRWLDEQGYAWLAGSLSPELRDEILAVAPMNSKRDPVFAWEAGRLRSQLGVAAARAFADREGDLRGLKPKHVETVHGVEINLYQWAARQRWLYGRGELPDDMIRALEAVGGWQWGKTDSFGEPITLPDHIEHGDHRGASTYGCPCGPCVRATRAMQAQYKREQMAGLTRHYVTAPDAVTHLRALMTRTPSTPESSVVAASGIPGTLARSLLRDTSTRIPPRIADHIRSLTVADLEEWNRPGTRGRTSSKSSEPVTADQQCEVTTLLADLKAQGWTNAKLSAELGYAGSTPKGLASTRITRASLHGLRLLVKHLEASAVEDVA